MVVADLRMIKCVVVGIRSKLKCAALKKGVNVLLFAKLNYRILWNGTKFKALLRCGLNELPCLKGLVKWSVMNKSPA